MKTRKDFFLDCLNVLIMRSTNLLDASGITAIQSAAWKIPETAIPEDPARAAFDWLKYIAGEKLKPAWLAEWEESRDAAEG